MESPVHELTLDDAAWKAEQARILTHWPASFRLAMAWGKHMPRGKSWVPLRLGRLCGRDAYVLLATPSGTRVAVPAQCWDLCASALGHAWDGVLSALESLLEEGAVFYDIGANFGYLSLTAAGLRNRSVRVFAFEPQRDLAQAIATSARLNGLTNLEVYPVAIGAACGPRALYLASHTGHASFVPRDGRARSVTCITTTIDQLVASGQIAPPNVIKLDVEGAELEVLRGAARTIHRHHPAVIFESDENARRFGYGRRDVCDYLQVLGLRQLATVQSSGVESLPEGVLPSEPVCDIVARPS
jgi:FkbM family methyltransferase